MRIKQLELPIAKEKYKYNLFRYGELVLATNNKKEVWDSIGALWGSYEVLDKNGELIEEFLRRI